MSQKLRVSAYVDYHILDLLAKARVDDEKLAPDWNAARAIWKRYKEDQIKLVTSVEEMELDFVIHMNRGGLCVTDTFQITDNIDHFESWELADLNDTKHWRAIVDLYDQLDVVNEHVGSAPDSRNHEHIGSVLREKRSEKHGMSERDQTILRECAALLHKFYSGEKWSDLKHLDYNLNWSVLREALLRHEHSNAPDGEHARLNKNLLGLLNRLVGISKKSCPKLPMKESHIDFVLDIVTKKYCQENIDRHICHIARSMRSGIRYYLTIDEKLIERFMSGKERLRGLTGCDTFPEAIRPEELEKRLSEGKEEGV